MISRSTIDEGSCNAVVDQTYYSNNDRPSQCQTLTDLHLELTNCCTEMESAEEGGDGRGEVGGEREI